MRKLIMTKGLPGSGKTTWAKGFQEQYPEQTKRINKDDLRQMIDNSVYSKDNEKFILSIRDIIIKEALGNDKIVIVDDTNLPNQHETTLRKIASEMNADFEVKDFTTVSLSDCIQRDSHRHGREHVGSTVIVDMYNKYIKSSPTAIAYDPELHDCVIVDLDGTLALLNRDPYRGDLCRDDVVCQQVAELIEFYHSKNRMIFFITGRPEEYRPQTVDWLYQHGFNKYPYELYMRPKNDYRKDYILKQELYETFIKNVYNVIVVFEDRVSVVDMWRDLGLKVFQVEKGNY